ncbi:uncharacterized protein LOC113300403 [Papaver somniferum]|uniref:uncharacterized protein LOC113300403 n=1 Tax=Papaver somniferum TaxID=3469 RepID=UPI000E6F4AE4|nr:uncharacterized protein LOC113300403 [Papaver somniferum]
MHARITIQNPTTYHLFSFSACTQVMGVVSERKTNGSLLIATSGGLNQQRTRVLNIYGSFLSTLDARSPKVTERGVLQILLDLRFVFDVVSGGDLNMNDECKLSMKSQVQKQDSSVSRKRVPELTSSLSQRLDPIDWQTYELGE